MSKTKTDKLFELYKKDRVGVVKNITKAAKSIPIDPSAARKAVKRWEIGVGGRRKKARNKKRIGGTLDDFRKLYDNDLIIPQKIEEGIKKYLVNSKGEPKYMKDWDFRELCGVPVGKWRRYAENYTHLQVKGKDGPLYWGHPDIIEEMREMLRS